MNASDPGSPQDLAKGLVKSSGLPDAIHLPNAVLRPSGPLDQVIPAVVTSAVLASLFVWHLNTQLMSKATGKDIGQPQIDVLADQVKSGAQSFLREEYKYLTVFVLGLTIVLEILYSNNPVIDDAADGARMAFAFCMGATLSALAGWLGMMVATNGNSRTTAACARG